MNSIQIRGKAQWEGEVNKDGYMTAYGAIGYAPVMIGRVTLYRLFTEINPACSKSKTLPIVYVNKDTDPYINKRQLRALKDQVLNPLCSKLELIDVQYSEEEIRALDDVLDSPPDFSKLSIELLLDLR